MPIPLNADSTVGDWLDHPEGGVLFRAFLAEIGTAEESLAPARSLSLQKVVDFGGGAIPQDAVDRLVAAAASADAGVAAPDAAAAPAPSPAAPSPSASGLSADSTVSEWLEGAPEAFGEFLRAIGATEESLAPARGLPLQKLVDFSGGQLPQSAVDDLVRTAGGAPAAAPAGPQAPAAPARPAWQERPTLGRFAGKTIVVTGAASGIGRATASRIAREGGRVIAVDVSQERLDALVAEHPATEVVAVRADITRQADIDAIASVAGDVVHGLANVAGVNDDFSPAGDTTDEIWDRVIGINLTGPFKALRALLPALVASGSAAVVNVASEAALRGNSSGNAYTVSKHGVIGLTRSAAFFYGPQGVRVNAVAPGGVATGIPFPPNVSEYGQSRLAPFQAQIPTIATAEHIAASIAYLLSDDSVNINGAVLPSDGGWSVQ